MKKRIAIIVVAVLLAIALGIGVYFTFLAPTTQRDSEVVYTAGDNTIKAVVDGSGKVTVEPYQRGSITDGVKLIAEDSDVPFFKWKIEGDYEIIRGGLVNDQLIILPLSDLDITAQYDDAVGSSKDQFKIVITALSKGFLNSLKLFGVTLLGAIPLGLIISFGSMSRFKLVSVPVRVIVWIVRGSPLMLQLLIIFYMPSMMFGITIWGGSDTGRFWAASVAFIINYACYFSEIFRGGIQGVPIGQHEAGQVLGLSKKQIFFKVTLMQMIKRIVPPMSNEIITLVKDTSLAQIIAVEEIIWVGNSFLTGQNGISGIVWPVFFTGVYYLAFSGILTILFGWVEKKLDYFKV